LKILFYNYQPNKNLDFQYDYTTSVDDILGAGHIDWLFIYEKNEDSYMEIISTIFKAYPNVKFIPIIDNKNLSIVTKFLALGATTFVLEPFNKNIKKVLSQISEISPAPQTQVEKKSSFCNMVGVSEQMQQIYSLIKKVAVSDSTVLITGESGTGKELVAKAIFKMSRRNSGPFIPVNCGAIPKDLLESELFGYAKGAFTGAVNKKIGRFQAADKGTIFLDEIGEMPLPLQVKILRVLQEKEIQPVGSNSSIKIDVRIIAATNQNLEKLVEEKKFREDLYYRLNVVPVTIPPLRERKEDIKPLVKHFFKRFLKQFDKTNDIKGFSDEALWILENYSWPGNIRELENTIERIVVLKDEGYILPSDIPPKLFQSNFEIKNEPQVSDKEYLSSMLKLTDEGINLKEVIENLETNLILQALEKTGGVKDKAAKLLNMKRTTLIEKLKRKNLM
jgi:DNA-binding NtrC family response regulator